LKITKYVHSCLLVETDDRVAIFDPGAMSQSAFNIDELNSLDDIFITHVHQDHLSIPFVKDLVGKFPNVRITGTKEVVDALQAEGIRAHTEESEGAVFFDSPHENVLPLIDLQPEEIGIHYLDKFSHPGDSHSFSETKEILALPITAPWGSAVTGLNKAIELKPKYVIPIHDWHWSEQAQSQMYGMFEAALAKNDIVFFKPETGKAIDISV
jgi:L-ascorbate metabolism protein UlaG (beta-lactamase superfamily)